MPLLGAPEGRGTVTMRCRGLLVQTSAVQDAPPLVSRICETRPKPLPSAATWKYADAGNETRSGAVGGSFNDQSLTSPLRAPVARNRPSGETPSAVIESVCPWKVR